MFFQYDHNKTNLALFNLESSSTNTSFPQILQQNKLSTHRFLDYKHSRIKTFLSRIRIAGKANSNELIEALL